ncbi:hypothetical protein [Deinococcus multiflagellatus]|uniref:Low temperature requirement A protein (LtrA) n=1 Tax=Deinococcus multiflagellatus TaxID=1656887 RepID=A0ABW1ZS32_9DEIO|nr:hypothetical protein [Deinococcus multiflagellatus]MBZ9713546.1 hypothetical protein [Deinococcus multiflagellatus]
MDLQWLRLAHGAGRDAWHLALGLALYLLGDTLYRHLLQLGPRGVRLGAAGLALLTLPLGHAAGGLVQLAACVALVVATLLVEARLPSSRGDLKAS